MILNTNTIHNVNTLKKLKLYSNTEKIKAQYLVETDAIMEKDNPSIYINFTMKGDDNPMSMIISEDDVDKLIQRLEETKKDLKEKKRAHKILEELLDTINNNIKDNFIERISIEYHTPIASNTISNNGYNIYRITVYMSTNIEPVYDFVAPMYLSGKLEIDKRILKEYIPNIENVKEIIYGPKLKQMGENYIKNKIKDMNDSINKRVKK